MSTIGENRLTIYNLLYTYPLYDYINENNELNVLILGTGWVGNEALKAVFWCGQYPNTKLNITIASQNAEEYKKQLLEYLPGLKQFADFNGDSSSKYHYANISIQTVSFEKIKDVGITDGIGSESCLNLATQSYIIVDVGDEDANYIIADEIKGKCNKNNRSIIAISGATIPPSDNNIDIVSLSYCENESLNAIPF